MSRTRRRRRGSAITEFGPSLWLFLILIFFPAMDMLALTLQYCCGWYMNFALTRELAVRKRGEEGAVKDEVASHIANVAPGLPGFIGLVNDPIRNATVQYGDTVNGVPGTVKVATTIEGRPFLPIPIPFISAPGLNANMKFTISSERPREVTN